METRCYFSNPVFLDPDPDPAKDIWNYSEMVCETDEVASIDSEVISDGENSFNLSPTFTYAEIIIISFLIMFLALKIFSGIWSFVHTLIIRHKWLR